jgi:hypothetical protein
MLPDLGITFVILHARSVLNAGIDYTTLKNRVNSILALALSSFARI